MTTRFSVTVAIGTIALCLVGCDKPAESGGAGGGTPPAAKPPGADAAKPAAAPSTGDWKTTASGLKYQVLTQGTGTVSPKASDSVKVKYRGTFMDGKEFDAGETSFPLAGVIKGWTEGLQLMKVGDKFKFEIPPDLAYGPNGMPPVIPPNSTLVFDVELLGIQ